MQVPGLPGIFFRDQELPLGEKMLRVYGASAVDVLGVRGQAIPYWPVAWPAGLGLARYLAVQPLAGKRVLEIGSGVGVSGLGAALAGAQVLVTDNEPAALRLAAMNGRRNGLRVQAAAADWRAWPLRARFDLVVGSDVTYEPAAFESLLRVLDLSLHPGGEVLLTDPGRIMTSTFQKLAIESRWTWRTTPLPKVGPQAIFLHHLARREG
jgi:predicted nicotinamide N-methyase